MLWFVGHTDVIADGSEEAWKYPPFSATIDEDKLYGRGAADMKGGIAAVIIAIEGLKKPTATGSLGLLITGDEEGPAQDEDPSIW